MTKEELIQIGFKEIPNFETVGDMLVYDLGRRRHISVSSIGTPNEVIFIYEIDSNEKEVTDVIVLRNYDYDGYTTIDGVIRIISAITGKLIINQP